MQTKLIGVDRTPPWRPLESLTLALLGLGTMLSRLPYLTPRINSHDAVNYALALGRYDVGLHQPHPPGYPLYVLMGRALLPLADDPAAALTWLSALTSGLAVCAVYLCGRRMWDRAAGLTAALGLAAALRQQNAAILSGLLLAAFWGRPWRHWLLGLGPAGLFTAAALAGPALLSGGFDSYWDTVVGVAPRVGAGAPLSQGLSPGIATLMIDRLSSYTVGVAGAAALPFIAAGALVALWALLSAGDRRRPLFLLLWIAPAWVFFLLVKHGNQATILICSPPLFLLLGLFVSRLTQRGLAGRLAGLVLTGALVIYQALIFTSEINMPLSDSYQERRAITLKRLNQDLAMRLDHIRRLPASGIVIIGRESRLLSYHLPGRIVFSPPRFSERSPRQVREVVRHFRGKSAVMEQVPGEDLVGAGVGRIILYDVSFRPTGLTPGRVAKVGIRYPLMKVVHLGPNTRVTFHSAGMEFR